MPRGRGIARSSAILSKSAAGIASRRRGSIPSTPRRGRFSFLAPSLRSLPGRNSGLRHSIVLTDLRNHVLSLDDLSKNRVDPVQVLRVLLVQHDEELTTASVLAGMCHRQGAHLVRVRVALGLAVNLVARTAGSHGSLGMLAAFRVGIAALDDKILDHAMKFRPIVEA